MTRLKKFFFNLYFLPFFVLITALALVLVPLLRLINALVLKRPEDSAFRRGIRLYGFLLSRLVAVFLPIRVEDKSGGLPDTAIFVANHTSAVDPYCFGLLGHESAFLTSWPFTIPVFKWVMKKAGYLDARKGWETLSRKGADLLARGCSLIIWPEGHRSRDGRLAPFRNGAFRLACETGYPIVPVCIIGAGQMLPPGSRLLTPVPLKMILLPPCRPQVPGGELERKTVVAMKKKVFRQLQSELDYQQRFGHDVQENRNRHRVAQSGT